MKKPLLSPVARKRLRRFIRHRRALASAWIFATISIAALSADLLANSNPLYIRFNNRSFFPVLRFYPEATFIPDGGAGRPDYKALRQHPLFTENRNNFMIFTPIPYGPAETIDEAKLADQTGSVRIRLLPIAKAANIDVNPERQITRQTAAAFFLGIPLHEDATGKHLDSILTINQPLREALQLRFNNEAAPAIQTTLAPPYLDGHHIDLSMPPYTPRSRPPRTLRLTIRLSERRERPIRNIAIIPGQSILSPPPEWDRIPAADRERILALTRDTLHTETPFEIEAPPYAYQVTPAADITWPHPPVKGHPLGIDGAGRDVLARIIHGLRVSLFFSLLLVSVSMTLGTLIGATQGYYGGGADILIQRSIEIWSAIPFLYVMILLGSVYGASFSLLLFCYALFNWIGISYYMRAEFLRLRNTPFVDAARVMGLRDHQIILRHILPNALTPIITFAPFSLVGAIASLAALDYLGFGLPALTPSLGQLLQQAQAYRTAWWLTLYPSATLFIVILLGVFIGEGVRDACDPRPRVELE